MGWGGSYGRATGAASGKSHHARQATNSPPPPPSLPQDRPKMLELSCLPVCCEQATTRNKSEIVTIHTDFHHATFPPISSPRENPRGRPPPSGAQPKIEASHWSSSACRAVIGREPGRVSGPKAQRARAAGMGGWVLRGGDSVQRNFASAGLDSRE